MKTEIIICGVQLISEGLFSKICEKYIPICFINYENRHCEPMIYDVPILSLKEAIEKYREYPILMLVSHFEKHAAIENLLKNGVSVERIINYYGAAETRWGCAYLGEYASLWKGELRHCCSLTNTYCFPFHSTYHSTGEETYKAFTLDTKKLIELIQNDDFRRKYCGDCQLLRYGNWAYGKTLDKINLGIESRCNFKCIYCGEGGGPYGGTELDDGSSMNSALEMLRYCKEKKILDDFAYFFISCGEPAIHSQLSEIIELVKDYRCTFATNASVYSEEIASVLKNGMSRLRVSIDAGTPETYAAVRGVNQKVYHTVHRNLEKYAEIGRHCVELQYIVLPGTNMDDKNIDGFCQFAKGICDSVLISRDRNNFKELDRNTISSIDDLRCKLKSIGIKTRIFAEAVCAFTKEEREALKTEKL